ncbi:ABC transporter substrate-binding protein [Patulibacter defluvii]|uniref:ABC transporter substrate-binding protein n=1 Tax=Patulibacter defluvii TaxID=3095358 RepID=UPI002A748D47|nr:ABC transporter substrate-binding protein [Patulibacter sp. DM4]
MPHDRPPRSPLTRLEAWPSSRRGFLSGALAGAAALGLSACGGDDGGSRGDGAGGDGAAGGARFPVTVRHQHGSTTIERAPRRVVSYGFTDHDTMLALGVVPVLVQQWIPEWKRGVGPWALPALGDARPVLVANPQVEFEKIAAARPDLIVAVNFDLKRSDYEKLSKLAPTVAPLAGYPAYNAPWDEMALLVGGALGRRPQTQRLVDRARGELAATARRHPKFAGATAATITYYEGKFVIYADDDSRGRFMKALGFEQPPAIRRLFGNEFAVDLSEERLELLADLDVLLALADGVEAQRGMRSSRIFQRLDVVRRGRTVMVDDLDQGMAISASSVTAIPFALDALVPGIARAVAA